MDAARTPPFATAAIVHRTLARLWKPLSNRGFRVTARPVAACTRPQRYEDGFLRVSVQLSQFGSAWSGNRLALNGERVAAPRAPRGAGERLLRALTADDCVIAERLEREIVERIRSFASLVTPGSQALSGLRERFQAIAASHAKALEHRPELFRPNVDIWLSYYTLEDVEAWGRFLLDRIPSLAERLEPPS